MHIFYVPNAKGNRIELPESETKHALQVLRLKEESEVVLIDGKGGYYIGTIEEIGKKKCNVKILEKKENYGKRPNHLHIAIAPTKSSERFEWFIEKAIEIGIEEITPIITSRSERRKINTNRLNRIIISAVKQSYKAFLPKLNPIINYNDFISQNYNSDKYIAHCEINGRRIPISDLDFSNSDKLFLIGPEGDFTNQEIQMALKSNFSEISLGRERLRTETAPIVICSLFNYVK